MPRYLIQAPHTAEECISARSELLQEGPLALMQFDFACAASDEGQHFAIAILDLKNEPAARECVPPVIRDKAQITEVRKVMPEEVRQAKKSS